MQEIRNFHLLRFQSSSSFSGSHISCLTLWVFSLQSVVIFIFIFLLSFKFLSSDWAVLFWYDFGGIDQCWMENILFWWKSLSLMSFWWEVWNLLAMIVENYCFHGEKPELSLWFVDGEFVIWWRILILWAVNED